MRISSAAAFTLACVLMLAMAAPAAAQGKARPDVAISWALIAAEDLTIPVGWLGAVSVPLGKNMAVVGEFGANYKTMTEFGVDVNVSEQAFLGGVKVQGSSPKVRPFIQSLFGGARYSGGADAGDFNVGVSQTNFAIQTGGGVDVFFSKKVALRIQGDVRFVTGSDASSTEFRFAAGVAFAFGG